MKLALAFVVGFYAEYYNIFARRTTKELYDQNMKSWWLESPSIQYFLK